MNRISMSVALGALVLVLGGCDHSLDDCTTGPLAVNYGPAGAPPQLIACDTYAVLSGAGVNCAGTTSGLFICSL